jgi:two-component system chemotaxis response regulator CheY
MALKASFKFLIVDDDADTRNLIKVLLRKNGFKNVTSVSDGEEAFRFLKQSHEDGEPVEILLVDWNMPNMNGMELLKKVQDDPRFSNIPFLMVTADNDRDHVLEVLSTGVADYIVKPIIVDVLLEKIVNAHDKGAA